MTNLSKSASPSEPNWSLIAQEIFNKSVLDSEEGEIWQDVPKAVSILKKYFAAEPRRDEREAPLQAIEDIIIREIDSSTWPTGGWLDSPHGVTAAIVEALRTEARASAPLPQTCPDCGNLLDVDPGDVGHCGNKFHASLPQPAKLQRWSVGALGEYESDSGAWVKFDDLPQPSACQTEGK